MTTRGGTVPETSYIRNGMGSPPYVFGPESLLVFVLGTVSAEVVERSPDGGEVEQRQLCNYVTAE